MWMRTTMNYQYRYGMTTTSAMKHLYKEGGILRFYRGIGPALFQGPISRFGDTAANVGILALLEPYHNVPIAVKTGAASLTAGLWRVLIMPIDCLKTSLQVHTGPNTQANVARLCSLQYHAAFHRLKRRGYITFKKAISWLFLIKTWPFFDQNVAILL